MKVEIESVIGILMEEKQNTTTERDWDMIDCIITKVRGLPKDELMIKTAAALPMTFEEQKEEAVSGRR